MERFQSEPFARTGYNFDRNEDGSPCTASGHDCLDFLKTIGGVEIREDGRFDVEEYECTVCGDRFSEEQVERMYNPEPVRKPVAIQSATIVPQRKGECA